MNEEQKKWTEQAARNFGGREFLRFGCAIMLWVLIWIAVLVTLIYEGLKPAPFISIIFGAIASIPLFLLPFVARSWKPAFWLLRKILGNESFPNKPYPRSRVKIPREPRPWWSYLPGLWCGLLTLLVFYLAIRYFLR